MTAGAAIEGSRLDHAVALIARGTPLRVAAEAIGMKRSALAAALDRAGVTVTAIRRGERVQPVAPRRRIISNRPCLCCGVGQVQQQRACGPRLGTVWRLCRRCREAAAVMIP